MKQKKTEYDVFISYRRVGGEHTAKIIKDELTKRGYRVFFDLESLRSGNFNTKLYSVIENAKDFILVLAPESLDRCNDEDDWVRLEIECALKNNINIVPVLLKGFSFPKQLPESINDVRYKGGIEANAEFFDAFIDKLCEFLVSKKSVKPKLLKAIPVAACAVALTAGIIFGVQTMKKGENNPTEPPKTTMSASQKNLTEDVFAYILSSLTKGENLVRDAEDTVAQAEGYLNSPDFISYNDLYSNANKTQLTAQKCIDEPAVLGNEVLEMLYSSEVFVKADLTVLPQDLANSAKTIQGNINYLLNVLDARCPLNVAQKQESINIVKENIEIFKDYFKYVTNYLIINVDKDYAAEFRNGCSITYTAMDFESYVWIYDTAELESKLETCLQRLDNLGSRLSALVGEVNYETMILAADFYDADTSTTAATTKPTSTKAPSTTKVPAVISEKQTQLNKLESELESRRENVRKQFAPDESMDPDLLWAYMGRNLMAGVYDQALTCLEMYDGKVNDSESNIYVPIMRQYIHAVKSGKVEAGGLMVFGYHPDEKHDFYKIGDIVVSCDGKALKTIDDYQSDNPDAKIVLLRLNEKGEFEKLSFIVSEHSKAPVLLCPVLS